MRKEAARVLLAGMFLLGAATLHATTSVSVSFFHQELAPYGSWVNVAHYGVCWHPARLAVGWQPYTVGHWVYTDYGWTWISEDPWGEYPYHYGSWTFVEPEGWVWIPGVVWSPAWVTWSYSDEFVGWAPVPPDFALTVNGYAGPPIVVSQTRYVFVPVNRFASVNVAQVRVPVAQNQVILARSQRVTGFSVSGQVVHNTALPIDRVERASGGRIERVSIERTSVRPAPVSASASNGKTLAVVAPAKTREAELVRVPQKESGKQSQDRVAQKESGSSLTNGLPKGKREAVSEEEAGDGGGEAGTAGGTPGSGSAPAESGGKPQGPARRRRFARS